MSTSKQLIINADDFGLTPGVTAGILYAHQRGILTSTTAMVNTPFAKASLGEARSFPDLGIGLHFVLDAGRPISSNPKSLIGLNGCFLKGKELMVSAEKQDIKEELLAQLELLYEWNGTVTHIDSHHHMHLHIPAATEAVLEVAECFKLPVRSFSDTDFPGDTVTCDHFHYSFYGEEHVSADHLTGIFANIASGLTEVMCHPAFMDSWLGEISSYNSPRMQELEILVNSKVKNSIRDNSLELVHYGGVANER
ncbi:ChbG/HpnK family deacetylase [Lentibacillus sediminis]|uniref:ChbG/HpnK family deacetylase n=1 Tax=Lentibacillus sediminis TaxID=1940529 RepID=UPI000C1C4CD5|nr:ChbG/HpnK family deacetylase [Lentibacillus sediminis]